MIRKYHNHTLQTNTRPYIIMHSIKQRNQFHFERKLYAQKCVSVSVPFVPNVVVEHVSGFVVCCVKTWVMWHTMLVSVYAIRMILWGAVKWHNYSPSCNVAVKNNVFPDFWQNYCRKTIEATTVKKVPNERKLIYAIYSFIVASWCLLFSYGSDLNTATNLNGIFLATLTLASIGIVIF